ncbi:MAG: hypothetical protein COZ18_02495 [Flexibacter sp. CG_4_10_14_3_um_filter_32_15]|nr:MAG: hypothetical protein COZ18_02495 [Flexibacter sp. CG_4_10_14_3_um_filter_32_15]
MDIDDFMNDKNEKGFNVNVGNALLRILEISNRNQRYVRTILQTQLEIKALLQGKTQSDLDDEFYDKVHALEEKVCKLAESDYHDLLDKVLDK